jgi:predicted NBD/HSP70 family sugar kinase
MGLAPNGAFFVGLKIGRRSLDLILVDFIGHIRARSTQTYRLPTPDGVVKFVEHALGQILDQLKPNERKRVAGLGIAMPFRMWDWSAALDVDPSEMSDWKHRDIEHEIAEICDFPVYLQNDGSAACGAEMVFGDQDRPQNFLYFFFGFFIGGGVVLNNTLFTGETGNAGALASLPLAQKNGKLQQLVDVASLATLETALIKADIDPSRIWHSAHNWDIPEEIVESWINDCVNAMSFGILSASSVIDFDCVVVDGWLPRSVCHRLISGITEAITNLTPAGIDLPQVRMGTIGNDARALGAASLALSNRFMVDQTAFMRTTK